MQAWLVLKVRMSTPEAREHPREACVGILNQARSCRWRNPWLSNIASDGLIEG